MHPLVSLRTRSFFLAVSAAAVAASAGVASAQTLIGDTVDLVTYAQSNGQTYPQGSAVVISPAAEFTQSILDNPISNVNIDALSIRLNSLDTFYSPYFNSGFEPTYFEIRNLGFVGEPQRYISGVDVHFFNVQVHQDSPVNWPAYSTGNVTFTADSVRISIGGYEFPTGSYVHVNLLTSIPAPGAAALLGVGGLVALRRRR